MLDTLPDKANKDYELYYDSSIYYAGRFLLDNKTRTMGKLNIKIFSTKNVEKFFSDVQDIESMGIIRDATKFEMSLKKEIDKDTKLSQEQEVKLKKNKNKRFTREIYHKKHARKTTITGSDGAKIVSGKTHTSQSSTTKRVSPNKKVSAKKTTRKK